MQDELHRASNQILEEARTHDCTHIAFESPCRNRGSQLDSIE